MTEPKLQTLDPGLTLIPASTCLINHVADQLVSLGLETLQQTTVVLPTMRLKVQLQAALYERLQRSFIPPTILTLAHLIRRFSSLSGQLEQPPLASDLDVALLVGKLLNSASAGGSTPPLWAKRLRPVHAHELVLLYKESEDLQVRGKLLPLLAEYIASSERHSEEALADIKNRVESIAAFFEGIDRELKSLGLVYTRAWDNEVARTALKVAGELPAQHGPIVVAGLTSAGPAQLEILRALISQNRVTVILPRPAETPSGGEGIRVDSPLHAIIHALADKKKDVEADRAGDLRSEGVALIAKPRHGGIVTCLSVDQEVDVALALAQAHISRGTPAHRIAIAITNEEVYRGVLVGAMAQQNISGNLALPIKVRQTSIGSWVEQFLACVRSASEPKEFLPLLFHPLTLHGANTASSFFELQKSICDVPILSSLRALPPDTAAHWLADRIEAMTMGGTSPENLKSITSMKSLKSWIDLLSHAIPEGPELTLAQETGDFECLAQNAVREFITTSIASPLASYLPMTLTEFAEFVTTNLLSSELHRIGEPLEGLQILNFAETRFLPLHVVIVTGCHEGQLPERLPQDELLDHNLKPHFGLRPSTYVENLQDMNFALLTSRVPVVYLCHSAGGVGSAAANSKIRSRYLDLLHVQNFPEFGASEIFKFSQNVPKKYELPATKELEGRNSAVSFILEQGGTTSPSRLRDLISCPYRWMVGASRLRPAQLPTSDAPPQLEGTLLHAVLEIFWTGRCASLPHCQTVNMPWTAGHERLSDVAWRQLAMERLREATHLVFGNHAQHIPLFIQLNTRSWPNLTNHLVELRRKIPEMVGASLHEWRFDFPWAWSTDDGCPPLHPLHIKGAIDTVLMANPTAEQGIAIIMDYKRTIAPQNRDIRLGLDPQLFLYTEAARASDGPSESWHGMAGYWEIYKGKWHGRLDHKSSESGSDFSHLRSRNTPSSDEARAGLSRTLAMRQQTVKDKGRYYADPSLCGLCDHAGLCRRDDPGHQDRIKEQSLLNQMLESDKSGVPQ